MEEVIGVKETKEGLLAVVIVGAVVVKLAKDGVDLNDALALAQKFSSDAKFAEIVKAGIEGADKIPAEIKDLKLAELLEIAQILPQVLEAIKA